MSWRKKDSMPAKLKFRRSRFTTHASEGQGMKLDSKMKLSPVEEETSNEDVIKELRRLGFKIP